MTAFHVAGLLLLTFAAGCLIHSDWRFRRSGPIRRISGMVVGHVRKVDGDGESHHALIRFAPAGRRSLEIVDIVGFATPIPPVGTPRDLVYPQDAPESARVVRPVLRFSLYAILSGMGVLITLSGLGVIS